MPTWLWAERNIGAAADQEPVRARDVLEGWRRSARHLGARHRGRRRCSPTGARRGALNCMERFRFVMGWAGAGASRLARVGDNGAALALRHVVVAGGRQERSNLSRFPPVRAWWGPTFG
jgi:hypothetical protein